MYVCMYVCMYIVITVSFSLVFVCLDSTGPEHVGDSRAIYLSKAQNHVASFQIIGIPCIV